MGKRGQSYHLKQGQTMKRFILFIILINSINGFSLPTPETAADCAKEMIGRQVGNASPVSGCALTLATQLRALSRIPRDGSRTEANMINDISEGFTSCYPAVPGADAAAARFIGALGEINDVNSTTFGGSSCLGDMWGDIDEALARASAQQGNISGRVMADPHIATLDGLFYSFQAEGIFTNLINDKKDLVIEGLYKKLGKRATATLAEGFALKLGKNIINISVHAPFLFVNGLAQNTQKTIVLNDGTTISKKLNRFEIRSIQNDQFVILHKKFLDLYIKLSPMRVGTIQGGILGNFDLNKKNDLTSKDGIVLDIETRKNNPKIYTEFGDSYRLEDKESLFCESVLSHYTGFDKAFPLNINQPPIDEAQRLQAKKICTSKDINQEPFLDNCIHDVIATGDNTFVESALMGQKITNNPALIFKDNNLGSGFNGYYELEFKVVKTNGEATVANLNLSTRTDDSAIEYRVDGATKYRVVTDYLANKIVNINFQNNTKVGFRKNAEDILDWDIGLLTKWTKTNEKKTILGQEATLYYFTTNNISGKAWIATTLKHNHVLPIKYLLGFLRNETFPVLLFPNYLFGYNYYGMILEAQIDDSNGSRFLRIKNISNAPDLRMLDLSDVVIKDAF